MLALEPQKHLLPLIQQDLRQDARLPRLLKECDDIQFLVHVVLTLLEEEMLLDGLPMPPLVDVSAAHALQQVLEDVLFGVSETPAVHEGQHHRLNVVVIQVSLLFQLRRHILGSIAVAFSHQDIRFATLIIGTSACNLWQHPCPSSTIQTFHVLVGSLVSPATCPWKPRDTLME